MTVPVTAPPVTWPATAPAKATNAAIARSRDLILSLCMFLVSSLYLEKFISSEILQAYPKSGGSSVRNGRLKFGDRTQNRNDHAKLNYSR